MKEIEEEFEKIIEGSSTLRKKLYSKEKLESDIRSLKGEKGALVRKVGLLRGEREEKYGELPEYPLFHSDWNRISREGRTKSRLNRRTIEKIVKKAARYAGIPEWEHATPQALRKAFKSISRSPNRDGRRLDREAQEYFMGHVLQGSEDYYYDPSDVDFRREAYSKLDFSREESKPSKKDQIGGMEELEEHSSE